MSRTVLIIKEETIMAASGREGANAQLTELARVDLTGFGDSFARWKNGLLEMTQKLSLSHVHLILPSSLCAAKIITLPYVRSKRDLHDMARRELAAMFSSGVSDYAIIKRSKTEGISVACANAEESALTRMLELMAELKISVERVSVPLETLSYVLPRITQALSQTAIFLFLEDGAVSSVLCEMGQYRYSSRSRLFGEPGTLDFGTEIVRNVSGIIQFQAAQQREHPITHVYFAGCEPDVFEVSVEGLQNMNLQVEKLPPIQGVSLPKNAQASEWVACIGAMIGAQKPFRDLNLLTHFGEEKAQESDKRPIIWHFLPTAISLVVCLLIFLGVFLWNRGTQKEIDRIDEWNTSAGVQEQYRASLALESRGTLLERTLTALSDTTDNLNSYPEFTLAVIEKFTQAGDEHITAAISGYDAMTGTLHFDATSDEAIDIPSYIKRLSDTGLFYSINYTGYEYTDQKYTLFLVGILNGSVSGGAVE